MEASVRHGALTSRSSVLVRKGFDLDTLTEFQGCRFGECDLDRHDQGVDRPPGILWAEAAGHHGVGDLFHIRELGRALEALGGDPDLRAEGDPARVVRVDLGLDPDAVQVGDRDDLRRHLDGLAGMRVPGRDSRRHRVVEAHRATTPKSIDPRMLRSDDTEAIWER